jgi:hypothetical protein
MDCRADTARVDVWRDRVQVRAGRRSMSNVMMSTLAKTRRGMGFFLGVVKETLVITADFGRPMRV